MAEAMTKEQRPTDEPLVTIRDVATFLGVSEWTVRDLAKRGDLPSYRPTPHTLRFRWSEVHAFVAARRRRDDGGAA